MPESPEKRRVLLIGWDAADWEHINPLLEEGLMPTLEAFINRGVIGNLATLQPVLSPMLWNSIATGKFPDKHGIHGFVEPDPVNGGARPYTSTSRKCKALWNILTQAGLRSNVVGWWASHPAEPIKGTVVTNAFSAAKIDPELGWTVPAGTVHPPELGARLARFKVFPTELTEAHILPLIPNAAEIDQKVDRRLESFAKVLADAASIHAVATTLMENEPWDFMAVYYDAIDHFAHGFMQYHPPKLPWVSDEDFAMYRDVMRGVYRFHDMMLERLLQLAGPQTTVILCSDHGFESGAQRQRGMPRDPAGPAFAHRQYGILAMAGEGIQQDERIYGASLVDIAPTILTLFGLPIGKDMDGRPLLEAFTHPPKIEAIPSWEDRPGEAGMHHGEVALDRDQAQELMNQFAALGYIEDPAGGKEKQAESAEIEAKYNLAQTHAWKNEPDKALVLLEEIVRRHPWEDRFLSRLASAYFQGGYFRQAATLLERAYPDNSNRPAGVMLLLAKCFIGLGEFVAAEKHLREAKNQDLESPIFQAQMGDLLCRLSQWREAELSFHRALKMDPDSALAHQGLSEVYRRLGENQKAADSALRAVGLLHRLPLAHFNLGVAMARGGQAERAVVAFETALLFQPNMINAHRYLATIFQGDGGDPTKAAFHRGEVARLLSRRSGPVAELSADRREKLFPLPEIPAPAQRVEILLRERPDPPPPGKSGKTFILVSGLPRSGTSLMMQLLAAGGLGVMTDGERAADPDNPRGYFEWEAIKQIARNPDLLDDESVSGRAIKCISMLLPQMPAKHEYKVIFMVRPLDEVVASQRAMTARLGTTGAEVDDNQLARGLRAHRDETLQLLRNAPHFEFIEIDYPTLVSTPQAPLARVVEFLGADRLPNSAAMNAVIDPRLHRRKKEAS